MTIYYDEILEKWTVYRVVNHVSYFDLFDTATSALNFAGIKASEVRDRRTV